MKRDFMNGGFMNRRSTGRTEGTYCCGGGATSSSIHIPVSVPVPCPLSVPPVCLLHVLHHSRRRQCSHQAHRRYRPIQLSHLHHHTLTSPCPFISNIHLLSGFLCPLSSNTFGIDFLNFTISDYQTKKIIFEVGKDSPAPQDIAVDFSTLGEDMYRKIKYTFSEDVLRLPLIQTT
jgi:hypothetical protein